MISELSLPIRPSRTHSTRTPRHNAMDSLFRFVLCPSYHGATALAFLLNNHPDLSCLGDTLPWAERNQSCSCGLRVDECAFWQDLARKTDAERFADEAQMLPLLPRILRHPTWNLVAARGLVATSLVIGSTARRLAPRACAEFTDAYQRLYASIRNLHGGGHVIDGSKSVGKVLALTNLSKPPRRALVLHLVRDPRGYACSLQRRGESSSWAEAGRAWRYIHGGIIRSLALCPRCDYLRIRYEDLCADSAGTLRSVFAFLGVHAADVTHPAQDPGKNHIIGNRMLRTFDGTLRLDARWQNELDQSAQSAVIAGAGRLARTLGYA